MKCSTFSRGELLSRIAMACKLWDKHTHPPTHNCTLNTKISIYFCFKTTNICDAIFFLLSPFYIRSSFPECPGEDGSRRAFRGQDVLHPVCTGVSRHFENTSCNTNRKSYIRLISKYKPIMIADWIDRTDSLTDALICFFLFYSDRTELVELEELRQTPFRFQLNDKVGFRNTFFTRIWDTPRIHAETHTHTHKLLYTYEHMEPQRIAHTYTKS